MGLTQNTYVNAVLEDKDNIVPFVVSSPDVDTLWNSDIINGYSDSFPETKNGDIDGGDSGVGESSAPENRQFGSDGDDKMDNTKANDFGDVIPEPKANDFTNNDDRKYDDAYDIPENQAKDNSHGTDSADTIHGSMPQQIGNNEKTAIITFDDGWKSQYENAKPILDEFGFKATFYLVCDYIGNENRLTWEEIAILQNEGHAMGAHTMDHANLDNIPIDSQRYEIVESKKCLEDNGIESNSFAYPFNSGDDNSNVLDLVSENYDFARTAGDVARNDMYPKYTIAGWSHDADRKAHGYSDFEMLNEFKKHVDGFSYKNGDDDQSPYDIPILIYHKIGEDKIGGDNGEGYSTSIDLFRAEMEYLHNNNFKVVAMDKVFG
ncbi:MAG: polysaccharide deacetylase family protein [Candidatus Nitrosocosmicus sp.]